MIRRVLGIDTSCYTTSVALAGEDGGFLQARRLLTVPAGKRGLMQSEGVFQHVGRLPELLDELYGEAGPFELAAVCVSARPRPAQGSYMPVFTVGEGYGRAIARGARVRLFSTTHQQGHVRAAMVDSGLTPDEPFLAVHLSGGTTEVLRVMGALDVELLGGTGDLHAGQFVDRVGVRLGLPFPAGPALEALALGGRAQSRLPAAVRGLSVSFSGAESQAQRLIEAGELSREDVAAEVFSCLARSMAKLIDGATREAGIRRVLLAGGVASSDLLRRLLAERLARLESKARLFWARPELSGDNAVGVALIGLSQLAGGDQAMTQFQKKEV